MALKKAKPAKGGGTTRNKTTIDKTRTDHRRTVVAELYLKGFNQSEISRRCGVTPKTISKDVQWIREEWLACRVEAWEVHSARELARLDMIEQQAWAAWERSQDQAVTVETIDDATGNKKTKRLPTKTKTVEQVGDPAFLRIALDCVEKRAKLLSLYLQPEEEPATEEVTRDDVAVVEVVIRDKRDVPKILEYADFEQSQVVDEAP